MTDESKVLGTFFGDDSFPVEWENEEEKQHLWFYDDLHCPLPCTPMYESMGWWGPTLTYMYRRFGAPFGKYWIGKIVNRYIYTAVLPRPADEAAKFAKMISVYVDTLEAHDFEERLTKLEQTDVQSAAGTRNWSDDEQLTSGET